MVPVLLQKGGFENEFGNTLGEERRYIKQTHRRVSSDTAPRQTKMAHQPLTDASSYITQ